MQKKVNKQHRHVKIIHIIDSTNIRIVVIYSKTDHYYGGHQKVTVYGTFDMYNLVRRK